MPLTEFARSTIFERALAPCIDSYGCGDASLYEWPNNVLSARTVVYESGRIARAGDEVIHRVDPNELDLCLSLAAEAGDRMGDFAVQMKSESDDRWTPYFRVADIDAEVPQTIDEARLRGWFGGTIHPVDRVVVEPLRAEGQWWGDVAYDGADKAYVERWKELIEWFDGHPALHGAAFAMVGFYEYGEPVDQPFDQPGYEMLGSCLPRMALAITEGGSLVGLFGYVTWT